MGRHAATFKSMQCSIILVIYDMLLYYHEHTRHIRR